MRHFFASMFILSLLVVLSPGGCVQTGAKWDHKVVLASDLTPSALDGQWEGSWQSYEFYDNGLIHFVITPADVAPVPTTLPAVASPAAPGTTRYLAHGKMWHYGLFAPEQFNLVFISTPGINGQVQFHGNRDLGPLDGACKYDGFVDGNKCVMSYVSRNDFGTVTLHRVVNAR
jgi:hypothetical protein